MAAKIPANLAMSNAGLEAGADAESAAGAAGAGVAATEDALVCIWLMTLLSLSVADLLIRPTQNSQNLR